jgi:hypothetical protein
LRLNFDFFRCTLVPLIILINNASDHTAMQKAWDAALANVLKFESKIRMETKMIGGEEIDCLVWVQSKSPRPNERSTRSMLDNTSTKNTEKAS